MPSKLNPIRRRVDSNQAEIVAALREYGCSVQHLHIIGKGCPDLLVGIHGRNYLIELKSNRRSKLTEDECRWFENWSGQVAIAYSAKEIINIIFPSN